MKRTKVCLRALTLIYGICAFAGSGRAESTAAAFLKVGAGARAAAMGGVPVTEGPEAVYWNPAGLAGVKRPQAGLTHALLYGEAAHDFVAFAAPAPGGALGAAITRVDYGGLKGRDITGAPAADFSAWDAAASLAFAREFGAVSAGISAKYLRGKIGGETGSGFAADAGLIWRTPVKGVSAEAAVLNAGPEFKFSGDKKPLPLTYSAGLRYSSPGKWLFAVEGIKRPRDGDDELALGAEYRAAGPLCLRAGYNSKAARPGKSAKTSGFGALDNLRGLSAGFGVTLGSFGLDYAFTPYGELGNAQRIGISVKF